MKIALVHDFLREYGGAERVVETMHQMWPEAPLYTSFVDWGNLGDQGYRFKDWDIREAHVALIPGILRIPGIGEATDWLIRKFHSPLRFLAPKIWESFNLSGYDVVISSSGWFMCRGVALDRSKTRLHESHEASHAVHICYIHHPPRNLYGYPTGSDLQKYWVVRAYAAIVNFFLRHYDWETAQRVDYFVANSKETARRVEKFYRRDSLVIYPPVDVNSKVQNPNDKSSSKSKIQKDYYLSVGRLTYAKRVDVAIEACNKLKLPLKIVGIGKEEAYLRSIAGPTIEFLGSVTDEELDKLYAGAKALIFCALDEDFGMVPVEAMAHGTPVIGLAQGGVVETVADGVTGVLFDKPEVEELVGAIRKFGRLGRLGKWGRDGENRCKMQAEKFSKERFKKELNAFIEKAYRESSPSKNF